MTVGKALALTAGFAGAVALGVAIGPSITDRVADRDASLRSPVATEAPAPAPAPRTTRTRAASRSAAPAVAPEPAAPRVAADEPRLHERLKPVLNRGAKLEIADDGFTSGEQFATVAHAARNTGVPFMVLKHELLEQGRSLEDAIHAYKPDVDAKAEVARARSAAKSDLATISGN